MTDKRQIDEGDQLIPILIAPSAQAAEEAKGAKSFHLLMFEAI